MAGGALTKESQTHAESPDEFTRASQPEAQVTPASILPEAVRMSTAAGVLLLADDGVWGIVDAGEALLGVRIAPLRVSA